ncbi:enoyl-CoA hydratase-related protein [Gordonia polyisoprenivorans]|uniref:enoyl-CoA hydratase-related protein n=1 Tax=Gordonia polyisoprenivorans TaxID=84595 RepID=UPI001AD6D04D|nr:enoyl-CoA hydratase-related protein [Gordonia polyisoprenivorans]QTI68689.1 enoyl-CoA hydratase/isomerase family protein [Gordonia polyisoprenivorans]
MSTESATQGLSGAAPEPVITVTRHDEIAVITLNRPDRLNAFTFEMGDQIQAAFDETDADDSVRAVVITGAGRAFCAGADLAQGATTFELEEKEPGEVPPDSGGRLTLRIFASLKPVVMAINGPSAGVGVTMTLPADARIASETARFGFVFTKRGLVPEAASTWFLPRLVGLPTALRWTLGAQMVGAAEALEAGLVQRVVAPDEVLDAAIAAAREMTAGTAPVSVALTRQLLWRMAGAPSPLDAHHADSAAIYFRGRMPDVAEGVTSFLEKREPTFTDSVATDLPEIFS